MRRVQGMSVDRKYGSTTRTENGRTLETRRVVGRRQERKFLCWTFVDGKGFSKGYRWEV